MNATIATMRITVNERGPRIRERLSERLGQAAELRCDEHGQGVIAVEIHARENGWFDSMWTTCCDSLERRAATIVRQRC